MPEMASMRRTLRTTLIPLFEFLGFITFAAYACRAGDYADWCEKMQPITPRTYIATRASAPPVIDGKLDDPAWQAAAWTADFVDILGDNKQRPKYETRAKILWDEENLYIAAEIHEPNIWATLTKHDSVIFLDPDFEVFIDPRGETQPYYEFEINALNTTWDLSLDKPYMDGGKAHNEWEIPGARTAVSINGSVNDPSDTDSSWSVELAFPWKALSEHARRPGPPKVGEEWRMNFSRVEWKTTVENGVIKKAPDTAEDNWVWSAQRVVDMHRPKIWAVVRFASDDASGQQGPALPGKNARDAILGVYYAQRDYFAAHHAWAESTDQLGIKTDTQSSSLVPVIHSTPDGYVCEASFQNNGQEHIWRIRQDRLLMLDEPVPVETEKFVASATEKFGDPGKRAAYFLVDNMPPLDRATLTAEFLLENVQLALEARARFPWTKAVPERIFLNDVLPYASLDEPRDPWRAEFVKTAGDIVRDCKTATEAAEALNRELFNRLNVHYNTARKRNNQSPKESIEQGKATCTGLSIILTDACRAVGIPARIVGVPKWVNKDGNHTWVEIWDGDWHFTGADEFDKSGLDHAWFNNDAALTARSLDPLNQVYATSWRRTGTDFPMSWNLESHDVPAVNVSPRYAALALADPAAHKVLHVRLRKNAGGDRIKAAVQLLSDSGEVVASDQTRAGMADLNDMPELKLPEGSKSVRLRFTSNTETRELTLPCADCAAAQTMDIAWDQLSPVPESLLATEKLLDKLDAGGSEDGSGITFMRGDSQRIIALVWDHLLKRRSDTASSELAAKEIAIGDKKLKWVEKTFGDAPSGKHSLWITMHGGGQTSAAENDLNWRGYIGRYEFPPGSINAAPRAPVDAWNMWHVPEVDDLFDRLISDMVLARNVDPNRIYLIGYSAGGDGVYQLAPRMSDRFAAAAMCAGHPNQVTPEGLRDLPFFLYMGGEDSAYNRNTVVREFSAKMDALQQTDPAGYQHRLTVFPGLPHNMQNRESEMIPRMAGLVRTPWPKRVVWMENDDFIHSRMYWLERAPGATDPKQIYAAHVEGQIITIESPASGNIILRLSDELLDLDQPVEVIAGGKSVFRGTIPRSLLAVMKSLEERQDSSLVATALLPIKW